MSTTEFIIAIVTAALTGGGITGIINALTNRKTTVRRGEFDELKETITELHKMNTYLSGRVQQLEENNAAQDKEIRRLEDERSILLDAVRMLIIQMEANGLTVKLPPELSDILPGVRAERRGML